VRTQRWGGSRTVALIAVVGAALVGGACSGDPNATPSTETATTAVPAAEPPAPTTTTAGSTVTTRPLRPDMSADEIAVRNVVDVFAVESTRAYEDPDPDHPGVNAVTTGDFKTVMRDGLAKYRAKGAYFRRDGGGVNPHRTEDVTFENPSMASVVECHIDDRLEYKKGDPNVVNPQVESMHFQTKVYKEQDGQWRLGYRTLQGKVPGKNECYRLE
jgi:hypothetical protein